MLATAHPSHARRSGYNLLAEYVDGAELLTAPRSMPTRGLPLFALRAARRAAFTRWYAGGSARLEWRALGRMLGHFSGTVHSLWADHDLGFLDLLPRRAGVKFCGTFHSPVDSLRDSIRHRWRLRRLDRIFLMAETQRPFFLEAGVDPARLHVVLHGVDSQHFTPGPQPDTETFTVLAVGGHRRNFAMLQSVCRATQTDARLRYLVVAPPDWRSHFADLPNVKFHSGIGDELLRQLYRTASCFALTAEEATANNALLEAMACGLPVVAENVGGIPEYLGPDCGELIPRGDVAAFAQALSTLAGSPDRIEKMRLAARHRAEELDWSRVARRMAALY